MIRLVHLLLVAALLGGQAGLLPCLAQVGAEGGQPASAVHDRAGEAGSPDEHAGRGHPGHDGPTPDADEAPAPGGHTGSHHQGHPGDGPLECGALMACGVAAVVTAGPARAFPVDEARLTLDDLPDSTPAEPRDGESPPPRSA